MSDFLIDFRPPSERQLPKSSDQLRFMRHIQTFVVDEQEFGLVLAHTGDPALWAPYRCPNDATLVAVAGRVALDEVVWDQAEAAEGTGGLAAKAIHSLYKRNPLRWMDQIGGNAVILIHDPVRGEIHLATDRFGVFPAFAFDDGRSRFYGSHPDVLAAAANDHDRLDEVSMAEFLLTSTVTPPYTYYQRIRAVERGTITTVHLTGDRGLSHSTRTYADLGFRPDPAVDDDDLAAALADALKQAVQRRTLRRFGRTAVALSGGLDSRAILSCIKDKDRTFAFCCFDQPNRELHVAEAIAEALDVRCLRWQREFEYYGDNAELGVRISGGMGTFANNHFLGVVERLHAEGAETLLTGCYCDYLFKGLPLNRQVHWLTGRETLASFRHQFYFAHRRISTPLAEAARDRWESRVAPEWRDQSSPSKVFQVESQRTFPLCYEGDNQQRVVPQRVTGWFLPVADRELMDVYCRLPYHSKLNGSVFSKAVRLLCGDRLSRVPDANTGVRIGASPSVKAFSKGCLAVKNRVGRLKAAHGNEGSWPDWHYYVQHSRKLGELWQRPNGEAFDFFRRVVGADDVRPSTSEYMGHNLFLLVSLLTMKLWLENRA